MNESPSPTPQQAIPAALPYRLLAIVYDLLPLLALWFATAAAVLLARGNVPVTPNSPAALVEFALMLLVAFAYFGLSWRRGGQTLGMRAWRLRLVRADGGAPPSWSALALRYLIAPLSLAAAGLGFLWSLFDRERRTWHDLASGTVLVRMPKPKKVRPQRAPPPASA